MAGNHDQGLHEGGLLRDQRPAQGHDQAPGHGRLDLSEAVANEIGEIYFENRKVLAPIVLGKKICNKSREAALTKASLHRLVEKVLNYVQYHPKRKGAEPAHGPVMWKLWAVLQKAGVTASGGVEGVLADFGVEGTFHYGYDGGENHVLSEASSAVCMVAGEKLLSWLPEVVPSHSAIRIVPATVSRQGGLGWV